MIDTTSDRTAKRRKLWLQAGLGAISGAAGMTLVLWLLEGRDLPEPDGSTIVAAGVAVIYVLMGVLVGLGALFPAAGAKLLNVQDRDEVLEQRGMLISSAVACALLGTAMLVLVFATTEAALLGPRAAFWLFAGVLAVTTVVSLRQFARHDELMRALIQESVALFGYGASVVLVLWGAGAAAALVTAPQPLDLISLSLGGILAATFVAIWRRGMMQLD